MRESNSICGHTIEIRRANVQRTEAADITPAKIVCEDEDQVGTLPGSGTFGCERLLATGGRGSAVPKSFDMLHRSGVYVRRSFPIWVAFVHG